jgi:hypothetical protein
MEIMPFLYASVVSELINETFADHGIDLDNEETDLLLC